MKYKINLKITNSTKASAARNKCIVCNEAVIFQNSLKKARLTLKSWPGYWYSIYKNNVCIQSGKVLLNHLITTL